MTNKAAAAAQAGMQLAVAWGVVDGCLQRWGREEVPLDVLRRHLADLARLAADVAERLAAVEDAGAWTRRAEDD